MLKIIAATALALMLGACGLTPQGDALRATVLDKARTATDEGLEYGEFAVCDLPTMGAVRRRYGHSQEAADRYNDFCAPRQGVADVLRGPPD